eukprot:422625-Rhodomonas_salina.1
MAQNDLGRIVAHSRIRTTAVLSHVLASNSCPARSRSSGLTSVHGTKPTRWIRFRSPSRRIKCSLGTLSLCRDATTTERSADRATTSSTWKFFLVDPLVSIPAVPALSWRRRLAGALIREQTIGARRRSGAVDIFDTYRLDPSSYQVDAVHFRSLDTWLRGNCRPAGGMRVRGTAGTTPRGAA